MSRLTYYAGCIILVILIGHLVHPPQAHGKDYSDDSSLRIMQPNMVSVEGWKNDTIHDPYLYPIDATLTYGGAFTTNFDICTYKGIGLYMNNTLHFDEGLDQHIVAAGWQYEAGATLWRWNEGHQEIQIFHQHHSQHELDDASISGDHFPVMDRNGIRVILYQRPN